MKIPRCKKCGVTIWEKTTIRKDNGPCPLGHPPFYDPRFSKVENKGELPSKSPREPGCICPTSVWCDVWKCLNCGATMGDEE